MRHGNVIIVGCGGIGGWLAAALAYTLKSGQVTLIDGDIVEEHNLDRQRFSPMHIDAPKVEALAETVKFSKGVKVVTRNEYLTPQTLDLGRDPLFLVGVDNHPARASALAQTHILNGMCFIGANETADAEAYCWAAGWPLTSHPGMYYPDIMTDKTDDPLLPPCTGEEQERFPQLAVANMQAASHMMWLVHIWFHTALDLDDDIAEMLPVIVRSNAMGGVSTQSKKDLNHGDRSRECDVAGSGRASSSTTNGTSETHQEGGAQEDIVPLQQDAPSTVAEAVPV